jgi:hypothetical protein
MATNDVLRVFEYGAAVVTAGFAILFGLIVLKHREQIIRAERQRAIRRSQALRQIRQKPLSPNEAATGKPDVREPAQVA